MTEEAGGAMAGGRRRRIVPFIILAVVFLVAGVAIVLWWLGSRGIETTDDAYVDATITNVAPRAGGLATQVLASDNQPVKAGQLLVQLDDSAARTQLASGEAAAAQARAQIAQAQAQLVVSAAQVAQAQANTRAPAAQAANAERDLARFEAVQKANPAAVAPQQLDQAHTTLAVDAAQLEAARKQVAINQAQVATAQAQLQAGEAQLKSAQAQIAQAQLQIDYARIVAPVDGHVTHKTVGVGDYVQVGQQVMAVVPAQVWVTANFKETQLRRMRPGQAADIRIDAYPDLKVSGHVDSIQWGAGQSFAALPAQNATGNFVKVIQRVPVKIVIDRPRPLDVTLGPGMSVEPKVRVGT